MKNILILVYTLMFLHLHTNAQNIESDNYSGQILKAAENGDINAQLYVAERFYEGDVNFRKDLKESRRWYEKAAEQGSAQAELSLFWFDYKNNNYHWDQEILEKAFPHLLKACKMGYVPAIFQLSKMHLDTNDYEIAVSGLKDCVKAEYPPSYALLAYCYLDGNGVAVDYDTAMELFRKALDAGDKYNGFLGLYSCYYLKENFQKAKDCLQDAIAEDITEAYRAMANMYANGKGVKQDFNEAHRLIDIAISKEPENPSYYDNKGEFYLMEGRTDKAKQMWKKVVSLDPNANERTDELAMAMNNNVDNMIPKSNASADNTYALIIANQEYKRVTSVPFAKNDGTIFAEYCKKALGLPEKNVFLIEDATLGDIKYHVNYIRKLVDAQDGRAKLIFYYAGHGIPDEKDKSAYLLPVDGYSNDPTSGFSVRDLYGELERMKAQSVIVFLDACFSGSKRDGDMLESARGVAIKPKLDEPKGQMVILSACQGDETAYPYKEMGHGMFTYFLLKKLQETKGNVNLGELADYVTSEVKRQSISINGKLQTPIVSPSANALNWKTWKLY